MSTTPVVPGLPGVARRRARHIAKSDKVAVACLVVIAIALLAAILGAALAPHDPDASDLNNAYVGPVAGHPLGFDGQGRDLLSRLLAGARTSILGPAVVVVLALVAGVVAAIVSAWRGGWLDSGISMVMDVLFAFPGILLAVIATAMFGRGLTAAALSLAVAYTPYVARVLRSAAVRERAREYIAACEVQGLSAWTICARHLVPNVTPLIVSQGTLLFGYAMVDLAAISLNSANESAPRKPLRPTILNASRNSCAV